ncbi:MAG TPA: hypothetical protein VFQ84_03520 [Arenimonas sp.]|uniref:hypothetical protein n=1 Tax=Arenimonas sp. TaxID=1872635 RepID=UPI002D808ED4|nr:hypothetical protein [Arenimonas sp.]HEU0152398.1 hypothetical protein [Arenimonas sp.]
MSTKSAPIQPVSERLPSILVYPAHAAMLWMIAALCALRLLSHLPSLLGLAFELAFWVMGFKLAVEALVNTVNGRFEPMGAEDMMATDGEAVNQILLMLVVLLPILAIALWGKPMLALGLLGLAVLLLPAAVMVLAVDHSLGHALNPLAWFPLIARLGGVYFGAVGLLAIMAVVSLGVQLLAYSLLPDSMGMLPASFANLYLLVAGYHLLGYVIHANHAALGLDVSPAVPRARFANPMEDDAVAEAEALAESGDLAGAARRLQDMFRGRGASEPLHERYRQYLRQADARDALVAHDREYISRLLATDQDKRALAVLAELQALDPGYRHALPDEVARLVAQAARSGQAQLAVALAEGFETRFPDHPQAPQVVITAATLMADRLGREVEAEQRLRLMSYKVRGHALETPLRDLLERVSRLSAITRGVT